MPFSKSQVTFEKDKPTADDSPDARAAKHVHICTMLAVAKEGIGESIMNAETGKVGRVINATIENGCVMLLNSYPG